MSTHTDRPAESGIGRWLRVGFFAFTVLGPAVNTILEWSAFLKQKQEKESEQGPEAAEVQTEAPEVKPSLSESLRELPYAQILVKRGEAFASDLRERGNWLSQNVTEHGGKV